MTTLTPDQLAQEWHCSRRTIMREIRAGNLVASKVAGRWIVQPDDAQRFLRASANVKRRAS